MKPETTTPRVDAALAEYLERAPMGLGPFQPVALARQLETELTSALAGKREAERERDELKEWAEGPNGVKWYIERLAAAERENVALRADKRRLDAIQSGEVVIAQGLSKDWQARRGDANGFDGAVWHLSDNLRELIDAAIDAGRQKNG